MIHRILLLIVAAASTALHAKDIRITHSEPLTNVRWITDEGTSVTQKPGGASLRALSFEGLSRQFKITLNRNDRLTRQFNTDGGIQIYRGTIDGMPGSWARINVTDGIPSGILWTGQEFVGIDQLANDQAQRTKTLSIYRLDDVVIPPGVLGCDDAEHIHTASDLIAKPSPHAAKGSPLEPSQAVGATQEILVGVVADSTYLNRNGSAASTNDAIVARMNIADGIFSEQVGVQLTVADIQIFDELNDPFDPNVTAARDMLDAISDFRAASSQQRSYGLTHLFTGKDLDGSTVGIAWRRALCSGRFGSALTQATRTSAIDSLVLSHEFGHNFGAPHDSDPDANCASTPENFLMAARLNNSSTFSQCSLSEIASHVAQSACITALTSTDAGIRSDLPDRAFLLGDSFEARFTVTNAGAADLGDVNASISLPGNVDVNAASTTVGTCTEAAGALDCALGALAAGEAANINIDVTATAVGLAVFDAQVVTPGDTVASNNTDSNVMTINEAVDLAVTTPAATTVSVNRTNTISIQLNNLAPISATNVTFSAVSDADFNFTAASWPAGNCTVTAGDVSCSANSLAAGAQSVVQITVSGINEGSGSYQLAVASADTDRDSSNDTASGDITVNPEPAAAPAPSGGGGGGGGSVSWLSLLILLLWRWRQIKIGQ